MPEVSRLEYRTLWCCFKCRSRRCPHALDAMIKQCDSIDLVIVSMLMCGCTRNEIMHEIGISKMAVSKRIKKMREFLKKFYELVYK